MGRIAVSAVVTLVVAVSVPGQTSLLVRERSITTAHDGRSDFPVTLAPVQDSPSFTVAVLTDTLTPNDIFSVQQAIPATFEAEFLERHRFRLIQVTQAGSQGGEVIRTAQQLRSAVQKMAMGSSGDVIGEIAKLPSILPQDWGHAVLVGRFGQVKSGDPWLPAWLASIFLKARCRASFWALDGLAPAWVQGVTTATLGAPSTNDLGTILTDLGNLALVPYLATWDSKAGQGAMLFDGELRDATHSRVVFARALATASGFTLKGEAYLTAREALLSAKESDAALAQRVLDLNPSDIDALKCLARMAQAQQRASEAVVLWRRLLEVTPDDGASWASLGTAAFAAGDFAGAENALAKADALGVKSNSARKLRAAIRMKTGDAAGALPMLEDALVEEPKSQDLWLLRADCAHVLQRGALETDSLQHAAALGPIPFARRSTLIAGYVAAGQVDKARAVLASATGDMPTDGATLVEYASFWDQVQEGDRAVALWKEALQRDGHLEAAYIGLAQHFLSAQKPAEASAIADEGLAAIPGSWPLILAKERALEISGDRYGARRLLAAYGPQSKDVDLLRRWALLEDEHGRKGAEAYRVLVQALDVNGAPKTELIDACRRGLELSIRDERFDEAKEFASRLSALGDERDAKLLFSRKPEDASYLEIPGGIEALHFLVLGSPKSNAREFLSDYSAALNAAYPEGAPTSKEQWQRLTGSLHEYFGRVQELAALGTRKDGTVTIELSLEDKAGKQRTEKAFRILGLKLKNSKDGVEVLSAEGGSQIKKQNTLAALAVDDDAIQAAFAAHRSCRLEIAWDSVPLFPAEDVWRKAFFEHQQYPGGLAEAFATDVRLPRMYLALQSMDRTAAKMLLSRFAFFDLTDRYSTQLSLYSTALSVNGTHAEVPGGEAADVTWREMVGVSPSDPVAFFEALMKKDEGRLIAFFYTLSQLDSAHQRFFTRSPQRMQRFYELFRDAPEMRAGGSTRRLGNATFLNFLREVPLDEQGKVDFPGSPEVWMVAKGATVSGGAVSKMNRKVKRSAAPDDEDNVLIRLAETGYKAQARHQSELDNFIAVSRIDQSRETPLEADAALLLAQAYANYGGIYPLLAELGDLTAADYQALFALTSKTEGMSRVSANCYLGELNSLLELLALLRESRLSNNDTELAIYRNMMKRFGDAKDSVGRTVASLDTIDDLARAVGSGNGSHDAAIRTLLAGNDKAAGTKRYRSVLALQKTPSLDALFAIRRAASKVSIDPAAELALVQTQVSTFQVVPVEKGARLESDRKKNLERFQTADALKTVEKLRTLLAKRKRNQREIDDSVAELIGQLEPWTQLAMTGTLYARFLEATDMLVSEDPLFLRKHEFIPLEAGLTKPSPLAASDLMISSSGEGSYFTGGLAGFEAAAGKARATGNHLGGATGEWFVASMLASVRATDWRVLNGHDLESFASSVRLAREWIVESVTSPLMYSELAQNTRGLLSLKRRKELLDGVTQHDWESVWNSVSISDLHFLGDALQASGQKTIWSSSPHLEAMREAAQHAGEVDALGPVAPNLNGCAQPRLRRYEPYEEFERNASPEPVAERLAELKQYVAWMADESAWPIEKVPALANAAADSVVSRVAMRDFWDWNAALQAYRALKPEELESGAPQ